MTCEYNAALHDLLIQCPHTCRQPEQQGLLAVHMPVNFQRGKETDKLFNNLIILLFNILLVKLEIVGSILSYSHLPIEGSQTLQMEVSM